MTPCSFLSTAENEVECFHECVFYNWEENGGNCPFRNLTGNRFGKIKDLLGYELFGQEEVNIKEIDEYYVGAEYIE